MLQNERDKGRLLRIIESIYRIDRILHRAKLELSVDDELIQESLAISLIQIGENTNKISQSIQDKYQEISWRKIKGMRNIITHEYHKIDHNQIFETATQDIPLLKEQMLGILQKEYGIEIEKDTTEKISVNVKKNERGLQR